MIHVKKLLIPFLALAVLVGGFALLKTSGNSSALADVAKSQVNVGIKTEQTTTSVESATKSDDQEMNDAQEAVLSPSVKAAHDAAEAKIESNDSDKNDEKVTGQATLSESEAVAIANSTYSGNGKITETGLEMEKGVLVYAVEYTESDGNEVDVKVNANTGTVVTVANAKTETNDGQD